MKDRHILIIEDQVSQAKNLRNHLSDLGYQNITICRNDIEALPLIQDGDFDLALVDIGLENSNLNGVALAKKIKEIQGIPIIFLTGFSDESTIQSTLEVGSSDYLVKPVEPRQLFVSLTRAFSEAATPNPVINSTGGCPFRLEKEYLYINNGSFDKRIHINEFIYAESSGNYVNIYTDKGKLIVPATLKSFLNQFNNSNIVRVHRSYAVNKTKVIERNNKVLILSKRDLEPIKIGRHYKKEVDRHFETMKTVKP
ncbi:MAG: response regulator transcription factor [Bacteroidetes bacterium]|nr:response regulator transcription factor [Bacteroidota bacterium]